MGVSLAKFLAVIERRWAMVKLNNARFLPCLAAENLEDNMECLGVAAQSF